MEQPKVTQLTSILLPKFFSHENKFSCLEKNGNGVAPSYISDSLTAKRSLPLSLKGERGMTLPLKQLNGYKPLRFHLIQSA